MPVAKAWITVTLADGPRRAELWRRPAGGAARSHSVPRREQKLFALLTARQGWSRRPVTARYAPDTRVTGNGHPDDSASR